MIWLVLGWTLVSFAMGEEAGSADCAAGDKSCLDELKEHGVIPDVIQNAWKERLSVRFPASDKTARFGNELTPTDAKLKPEISWKADEDSLYTICMTDPDAPSRKEPKFREWLHWLVVNVPGSSIGGGTTLADYRGPGPPKGTGLHRYVLFVYKQPKKLTVGEVNERPKFSIADFAKKYDLGDPVAGNFFQAKYEEKSGSNMADVLKEHGVVPDVIETAWQEKMSVRYPDSNVSVEIGNELTPTQVRQAPDVSWKAEKDAFYVLCMTDPDAPSRKEPTLREILHWLVVNVPGSAVDQGTTIASYRGSGPPKGTGLHRYIFLAYKQPKKLDFDEKPIPADSREGRPKFAVAKFAQKYNLGDPVAGNFFQAQFEEK